METLSPCFFYVCKLPKYLEKLLFWTIGKDCPLDVGTYRVIFELFDKYGNKMSENFANFIVVDKPNI